MMTALICLSAVWVKLQDHFLFQFTEVVSATAVKWLYVCHAELHISTLLFQCPSVCLSVRLSLSLVYCVQMAKNIVRCLSPPASHVILVSGVQALLPHYMGKLPLWGHWLGVGWKNWVTITMILFHIVVQRLNRFIQFCNFWLVSVYMLEMVQDRPWCLWNISRKS